MLKKMLSIVLQALPIIAIFILIAVMIDILDKTGLRDQLTSWIAAQGEYAVLLYIVFVAVLYSLWASGNVLGAMGYILFGYVKGVIYFSIAGLLSCIATFFIIRYFFQKPFQSFLAQKPKLLNIQKSFQQQGWFFYVLIRISPFHAVFVNGLFALSTVRFRDFFTSLVAMIPQWMLFVYFGYCAATAVETSPFSTPSILRYISLTLFIGVILYIAQLTQKIIRES